MIAGLVLAVLLVFGLYGGTARAQDGKDPAQWTFLVYLDADNNLEGVGIDDFLEMASVGSTANVNIVVQFDRISGYDSGYDDWTDTRRGRVNTGDTPTTAWGTSIGEVNMADKQTLINFVVWGMQNYPASNYAVVLWNHGGGWRDEDEADASDSEKNPLLKAVCWDDTSGGDSLYTKEVREALESIGTTVAPPALVGFDACYMGMIELAYELRNTTDVMVGSEETEPGPGWPYNTILGDLTANPAMGPAALGTVIVQRYYQSYGNSQTQAATDLSQMDTLAGQVDTLAQTLRTSWNTDTAACVAAAGNVMTAIDSAVIAEAHGTGWPGSHGLAIYFPTSGISTSYTGSVVLFPGATRWEEFLADYQSGMGGSWVADARAISQVYGITDNVDLYDFCQNLVDLAPDDLMVTPDEPFVSAGDPGGPFVPASKTYTLTNTGSGSLNWSANWTETGWLDVSQTSGSLNPSQSVNVQVSILAAANSLPEGVYTDTVDFTNQTSGIPQARDVTLRVGQIDYFTEQFSNGDNDLDGLTIIFTPDGSASHYSACRQPVPIWTNPAGGTVLSLGDDGYAQVVLSGLAPFYGVNYGSFYVGSNGYLTFEEADTDYSESLSDHFATPRLSGLFDDLNPSAGGAVSWKEDAGGVVVTYDQVPEYNTTNDNSFQMAISSDGTVRVTWLNVDATDGLAGLSNGNGVPADFLESDLSAYAACGAWPPTAYDVEELLPIGTSKTLALDAVDDGLPNPPGALTYIIETLPAHGTLEDAGGGLITTPHTPLASYGNQVIYTPNPGYNGPDSFTFKANDGGTPPDGGDSNIATCDLQITDCQIVSIGDGEVAWAFPLYTYYHDSRTQVIYRAEEIGTACIINQLSLDVASLPGQALENWTIRMKHTPLTQYGACAFEQGDWQIVFQDDIVVGETGALTFVFDTPFAYNGTDNLMIDFSHNNDYWTSYGTCLSTDTASIRSVYGYSDSNHGDPLDWEGSTEPTAYCSVLIPNIELEICPTGPHPPVALNGQATTCQASPVTVTLVGSDDGLPDPPAALTYIIETLPAHGTLTDPGAGAILAPLTPLAAYGDEVIYTPQAGYSGPDVFTFKCNDGGTAPEGGDSNIAVIDLDVLSLPAMPNNPLPQNGAENVPPEAVLSWNNPLKTGPAKSDPAPGATSDTPAAAVDTVVTSFVGRAPSNVAIFQDNDPWGYASNQDVLTANGISWTIFGSADMGTANLATFDKVIIASVQPSGFYDALEAHSAWFEAYVNAGGILDMHLASMSTSPAGGRVYPGGYEIAISTSELYQLVSIVDATHPVVNTPHAIADEDLDNWNFSTHGYISGHPVGAHEILEDTINGQPCAMESMLGIGRIFVTTQTMEWSGASTPYLENTILHDVNGADVLYDVYLDRVSPPTILAAENLVTASYDPQGLGCGTFYWQVVAKNQCGQVPGPIWSFRTASPLPGDFEPDCDVDLADVHYLLAHWLEDGCTDTAGDETDWCFGADLNRDGSVNLHDAALQASYWLEDLTP
ncbi:MAG: hypothetical protein JW810_11005 [Sedimentisphaerales bacterium]|nr:hypothetical protein [Sedimentisphaerales bacterium]